MPDPDSRILTLATLRAKGACRGQLATFHPLIGDSAEVTEALCMEHAAAFDWSWAAEHLLSKDARAAYEAAIAPARAAYKAATAPAEAAYLAATAPARAAYKAATAPAEAAYWAATAPARAAYRAAIAPAEAAYEAATASAWARAYIADTASEES